MNTASSDSTSAPQERPRGPAAFVTTHWSMIVQAGATWSPEAGRALEELCASYWYPLYAYARRKGVGAEDAEDLTQAFFEKLLERRWLSSMAPDGGRFRSFLLTSFQHFLVDDWHRRHTIKRGGHRIATDDAAADTRYAEDLADAGALTPDQLFARRWALEILEQALQALGDECARGGKGLLFELLRPTLTSTADEGLHESVAARCGMTAGAVAVAAHRLRERYRRLVREVIGRTVAAPTDIEAELRELMTALRGGA